MMTTKAESIARYCADLGWYLVAIPAGTKGPRGFGWQNPERAICTAEAAAEYWTKNPDHNVGLLHAPSGTAAFDVDHIENTRLICEEMGIDYDAIMRGAPRIVGRQDRGKVLFKVPRGLELKTHKISWPCQDDPRKTEVVFELRAGSVQDVLPPSVHPDTGNPYTWAGPSVFDGIPDIPAPLLTLWTEWDRFRGQLQDICPWKPEPSYQPPRKQRPQGERSNVIDAFNGAHDIAELLERFGYKRTGRNRYLSPNSSSGLAGVVVFDDGRAYSHHASDPFDSAHAFDAFDLWCQYEHMGNVSKAVADAGEFLGVVKDHGIPDHDPEAIAHGAQVAEAIMPSRKRKSDTGGIPEHLLTVPGRLQDAVNLFNVTAVSPQPQFAVLAALALGSTVMGRRWVTSSNNFSNCYFIAIGETGCGKEYIRKFILRVLADSGLERMIGPSSYTSASGVLSSLLTKPTHITIIDEMGRKLKQAASRDNTNAQGMLTALMEVFGMQDGVMSPQGFSKIGVNKAQSEEMERVVRNPSLTVIGMSTGHDFADAIGYGDVASGFLNRFLIVETDYGIPLPRMVRSVAIGEQLKDWCHECATAKDGTGLLGDVDSHDMPPAPVMIEFSRDAIALLDEVTREIHEYRNAHKDSPLSAMKSRSRELIMRLSLIVARSCEEAEISAASLTWARDFVTFYTSRIIRMIEEKVSINDFHAICNKAIGVIKRSGLKGVTGPELCEAVPPFKGLKVREREEVMKALIDDYGIAKINRNEGKRGRPAFCWIIPASEE
jgi:hypothetical protein